MNYKINNGKTKKAISLIFFNFVRMFGLCKTYDYNIHDAEISIQLDDHYYTGGYTNIPVIVRKMIEFGYIYKSKVHHFDLLSGEGWTARYKLNQPMIDLIKLYKERTGNQKIETVNNHKNIILRKKIVVKCKKTGRNIKKKVELDYVETSKSLKWNKEIEQLNEIYKNLDIRIYDEDKARQIYTDRTMELAIPIYRKELKRMKKIKILRKFENIIIKCCTKFDPILYKSTRNRL